MKQEVETISLHEAKAKLSSLIKAVEAGNSFCITKHGQVVAQLGPAQKAGTPVFGSGAGKGYWMSDDFDAPEAGWEDFFSESTPTPVLRVAESAGPSAD